MSHTSWKTHRECQLTEGYTEPSEVTEARRGIRLSMALAQTVYDRRTELGLTQAELGERAGLTQAEISRIEGSDTVPAVPLLAKLAAALDATLNIALDADDIQVSFTSRHTDAAWVRHGCSDLSRLAQNRPYSP
ncbi:helix-turn-helix domain-containing protein [Nocardia alba]|uniref:Helix-turn-helix protein n=1 Tax=Nocardia alba TaxID=225051 RepID=A0A4R1FK16_9NOCA|nr:helix-turn-helix domain-containing protein [Nocardia alba]TCJ93569.1 helix-turn-helix protein [Nocardia alba]